MLVGWLATRTAQSSVSKPMQYLALIGFVIAEALLFIPLLAVAQQRARAFGPGDGVRAAVGRERAVHHAEHRDRVTQ